MADSQILQRMRADWNGRAAEDANYYVAFGRRNQDDEEFFASGADVVRSLEAELRRLTIPASEAAALEIGCGPGRLIRPMSRHFREIHGVDVSNDMIRLATEKLRGISNAHVTPTQGADLARFGDESFDFVYSYAVFQHIPSREVVLAYLAEARRVLKPGGILRCQINGLPPTATRYTTWEGVRLPAGEVTAFARDHDFQLLALEGAETQYMWTTWRKRKDGWRRNLGSDTWTESSVGIRNVSSAYSAEPAIPVSGPLAAASLWIENLPGDADLIGLSATVDGIRATLTYLGPPDRMQVSQLNLLLPPAVRTGLVPLVLSWLDRPIARAWTRVIPAGPLVPRICSVTDGVDLLSEKRIVSGSLKISIEETAHPEKIEARVNGISLGHLETFCTDPLARRYEVNGRLPDGLPPGIYDLSLSLGTRRFAPIRIEVA